MSKIRRKVLKFGEFESSAGIPLQYYYNFRLLANSSYRKERDKVVDVLLKYMYNIEPIGIYNLVGTYTVGAYLASFYKFQNIPRFSLYNPHDDRVTKGLTKEEIEKNRHYIIVDDVITTGATVRKTIEYYETKPSYILCLVNRSKLKTIEGIPIIELLKQDYIEKLLKFIHSFKNKLYTSDIDRPLKRHKKSKFNLKLKYRFKQCFSYIIDYFKKIKLPKIKRKEKEVLEGKIFLECKKCCKKTEHYVTKRIINGTIEWIRAICEICKTTNKETKVDTGKERVII